MSKHTEKLREEFRNELVKRLFNKLNIKSELITSSLDGHKIYALEDERFKNRHKLN